MRAGLRLAPLLLALLAPLVPSAARADADSDNTCPLPHGPDFLDRAQKEIRAKKSCQQAVTYANACALGSSGDSALAGAAIDVCKQSFTKKPADRQLFEQLRQRCTAKFSKEQGTLYVSMNAFCALRAAQLLDDLNRPIDVQPTH